MQLVRIPIELAYVNELPGLTPWLELLFVASVAWADSLEVLLTPSCPRPLQLFLPPLVVDGV
eukprot:3605412-Prorocentrum_lima.AAC.1